MRRKFQPIIRITIQNFNFECRVLWRTSAERRRSPCCDLAPAFFLMPYKSYSLPCFSKHHSSYYFLSASLKFQTIEQKVVDRILWHWQGTIVITASSLSWLQMTPMERTRLTSMGGRHTTTILTTPSQIPKVLFKWGLLKIR